MIVFLNGRFVPDDQATVSVFDRGFTYGDGLFETVRVTRETPFRWEAHMQRLKAGADFLGIELPITPEDLRRAADQLIVRNGLPSGALRVLISRGMGARGYSSRSATNPTLVMTIHEVAALPESVRVMTSSNILKAGDPLLGHKTCNKLVQILARQEAERAGFEEALLVNDLGHTVSATSANLFWVTGETVCTAPLSSGALPGVTRAVVREICSEANIAYMETTITVEQLASSQGVFLTSSIPGIVPVSAIAAHQLGLPKLVRHLISSYERLDD